LIHDRLSSMHIAHIRHISICICSNFRQVQLVMADCWRSGQDQDIWFPALAISTSAWPGLQLCGFIWDILRYLYLCACNRSLNEWWKLAQFGWGAGHCTPALKVECLSSDRQTCKSNYSSLAVVVIRIQLSYLIWASTEKTV